MSSQTSAVAVAREPEELIFCQPADLASRIQVREHIARRAFERFQARGCEHGRDWQDWLEAEAEFLRPVTVELQEDCDKIVVRAGVLGFQARELQAAVEPRRLIIAGKKDIVPETGDKVFYVDWSPDEILRVIELPADVVPASANAKLVAGVVEFTFAKKLR